MAKSVQSASGYASTCLASGLHRPDVSVMVWIVELEAVQRRDSINSIGLVF